MPVVTERVVIASPTKMASTAGTWNATDPGVWPGSPMTRGEPGTSRTAPGVSVETSATGVLRRPPCVAAYARKRIIGRDAHGIPGGARLLGLAARLGGIGSVDPYRHAMVAPQPLRESDMVDVAVGQQDRRDIVERAAHGVELGREILPEARQTGVDDRHPAALFDEVAVDQARRAEPMEMRGQLHAEHLSFAGAIRVDARQRAVKS